MKFAKTITNVQTTGHPTKNGIVSTLMQALQAQVKTRSVEHVYFAHNTLVPPVLAYVVGFPRLSLTLSGCEQMEMEQDRQTALVSVKQGQAVFVAPHCWNKPNANKSSKVLHVLFGKRQTGFSLVVTKAGRPDDVSVIKHSIPYVFSGHAKMILLALLAMGQEKAEGQVACLLVQALLHEFVMLLKKPLSQKTDRAQGLFDSICAFVQTHFEQPLTREAVARHFGVSPGHVSRVFKVQGFLKFCDYLAYVRMDRAKYMLKEYGALSLQEIAFRCGYEDLPYFCRVFKKVTKLTPTEFRVHGG